MANNERTDAIQGAAAPTILKLRELERCETGGPIPEWMNVPGGWGKPLSALAKDAADAIEGAIGALRLTERHYQEALALLQERQGKPIVPAP